jgi:hypothetical protein
MIFLRWLLLMRRVVRVERGAREGVRLGKREKEE